MAGGLMSTLGDTLDVTAIRKDFPLLERSVHGKPIVYVDSAATSQKPRVVLDTMTRYYETINANVHRGVYYIAEQATNEMEAARRRCATSSAHARSARSSSPRTPPSRSTSSRTRGAAPTSRVVTWSC